MKYDAILVLSGGIIKEGKLTEWSKRRLDKAIELYKGEYIIPLSAWTVHKPLVRDKEGFPLLESDVAARYLIEKGINRKKIIKENTSYDTIGNAFFARIMYTDIRKFRKLLIITSEFHMPRTKEIFEWVFKLKPKKPYKLEFLSASDKGISKGILEPRIKKERERLKELRKLIRRIKNLEQLHKWIFEKHDAYAAGAKLRRDGMK